MHLYKKKSEHIAPAR